MLWLQMKEKNLKLKISMFSLFWRNWKGLEEIWSALLLSNKNG